jgi:hypothetical protein
MPTGKEVRYPLRRPFKKAEGKRGEEGVGRRIRQRPTRLAKSRVNAHIRVRPSSREIQLEEGTNQSIEPGPCETNDATWTEFMRLGGASSHGGGQRAVTK